MNISEQLLAGKKSAQEAFLKSILSKEGKCWSDFNKYVKRRKGNKENIPAIKSCNGRIITDVTETPIIRQYSAVRAIFFIHRMKKQVIHSPLILKQLGEGLKR